MPEAKEMTTYEIVAQSKIQKAYGLQNKVFKTGGTLSTPHGTKIKMVPANQFVQLKPPIQSQSKIYTIKPPQSQQLQQTTNTTQYVASPQKFTILKPGTSIIRGTKPEIVENKSSTDIGSIIDMPILFADNDGNIQDGPAPVTVNPTKSNQFVLYNTSTSTVTPGSSTLDANKPKKVVFINRTTMKPCPNIISKSTVPPLHKYSKVVVTKPNSSAGTLVTRAQGSTDALSSDKTIVSNVRQINIQPVKGSGGGGVGGIATNAGVLNVQQKPIIINMNATDKITGKPQQILKLGDSIKKTFVLKTASGTTLRNITGIKPIQQINRNLTVRKIDYSGNVITTTATSNLLASLVQSAPKASEPKILTLQPPTYTLAPKKPDADEGRPVIVINN